MRAVQRPILTGSGGRACRSCGRVQLPALQDKAIKIGRPANRHRRRTDLEAGGVFSVGASDSEVSHTGAASSVEAEAVCIRYCWSIGSGLAEGSDPLVILRTSLRAMQSTEDQVRPQVVGRPSWRVGGCVPLP